ncbi:LacI family DNA-binding transcriptional regulator [Caballeronia sp. LZ034LL]|uniref:LacI family DNA-binding transcriptional regulator n=1 Tax=Caballeronia sp. LZ034LL TaxID=3038567 RepID=UPI0028636C4A|nr:LacI family DNA-binding transcriptional regulator [Caballeronia sp. LZ034LL]MDR5835613.1 LacI family DNA-binding transcriptional regulator [Caballeronia sp. LZ034LL]
MSRGKPGSPVTLLDIANELGLSRATVSLVLRNSPRISEATRERVLEAFKRQGYVYNRHAAGMRSNQTHTVGVVVNDLANPYFTMLVRAIEASLSTQGFMTLLGNTDESLDRQSRFLETVRQHNIDGLIVCPTESTTATQMRQVLAWGIPCVFASRYVSGLQADYVGVDNRRGMALATSHLIGLGHKRIAMIGGIMRASTGSDRAEGYREALQAAKIKFDERLLVPSPLTRYDGKRIITELLRLKNPPTAVVCGNDIVAFGVMLGLRAHGIEPGRDFGVVGFDDVPEAALWEPPLTTVQVLQDEIGQSAADLLLKRMTEPSRTATRILSDPVLIIRGTCGGRPGAA